MAIKTVLMLLMVVVAAAEGRARGSKLGHGRISRQHNPWVFQNRQDAAGYPQTGAPQVPAPVSQPAQPGGYPSSQGQAVAPTGQGSYPSGGAQPAVAPVGYPSGGAQSAGAQVGYPSVGAQPAGVPIGFVISGLAPLPASVCKYPGFFPTPGSCVNFYRCVDWFGTGAFYSVFQFNCPAGTIFDDDLDICNHIGNVVGRRPECSDMLMSSLVPVPSPGTGTYPPTGTGTYPPTGTGTSPPTGTGTYPPTGTGTYPPTGTGASQTGTGAGVIQPGAVYPTQGGGSGAGTGVSNSSPSGPPRPFSLECVADDQYRRHPLYCNKYYTCTWDGQDWVFPMLTCPQGLIFNDARQECSVPATTIACQGELAPTDPGEPLPTEPPTDNLTTADITTTDNTTTDITTFPEVAADSLHACPAKGYYPYEGDCIRFYKCVALETGPLKGLLYRCPEGYGYSEEKKRCDKNENLPPCTKSQPAHLRAAPAIQLTEDMLAWFFVN